MPSGQWPDMVDPRTRSMLVHRATSRDAARLHAFNDGLTLPVSTIHQAIGHIWFGVDSVAITHAISINSMIVPLRYSLEADRKFTIRQLELLPKIVCTGKKEWANIDLIGTDKVWFVNELVCLVRSFLCLFLVCSLHLGNLVQSTNNQSTPSSPPNYTILVRSGEHLSQYILGIYWFHLQSRFGLSLQCRQIINNQYGSPRV